MFLQYKPLLDYNAVDFHKHMGTRSISVLLDNVEDTSEGSIRINPLCLIRGSERSQIYQVAKYRLSLCRIRMFEYLYLRQANTA